VNALEGLLNFLGSLILNSHLRNYKMKDKRAMLRVKIKSLAEEAKIIRFEEARTKGEIRDQLHRHRVIDVRMAARNSHIAYTLIRGKEYSTI
jgi:hypothetical protein